MMEAVGVLVRRPLPAACRAAVARLWFGVALALAGCSAGAPSVATVTDPTITVTITSAGNQTGAMGHWYVSRYTGWNQTG